jgi:hypothetical protein
MKRLGAARWIVCGVAMVALSSLLAPVSAGAKGSFEGGGSEAAPGVTVTGIGFAPAEAEAAERAVRDARQRATSIARALRLDLGDVEAVELPELTQFGFSRSCPGQGSRGCRRLPAAAAATVTYGIVGGGTGEGTARSIRAHGTASTAVESTDRSRNRSIRRALLTARREIAPRAALAARRSAARAANATDLQLGAIVSVEETLPYYYGTSFYDAALGSFGPGRFCGIVKRPILRRDPETGEREVVRRVRSRRCFVSSPYGVQLTVEYEADV